MSWSTIRQTFAAEVRRRRQEEYSRTGRDPRIKQPLADLSLLPSWSTRCGQWSFPSLYSKMRTFLAGWRPVGAK